MINAILNSLNLYYINMPPKCISDFLKLSLSWLTLEFSLNGTKKGKTRNKKHGNAACHDKMLNYYKKF